MHVCKLKSCATTVNLSNLYEPYIEKFMKAETFFSDIISNTLLLKLTFTVNQFCPFQSLIVDRDLFKLAQNLGIICGAFCKFHTQFFQQPVVEDFVSKVPPWQFPS